MDDKSEMRKRVALLVRSNTFEALYYYYCYYDDYDDYHHD